MRTPAHRTWTTPCHCGARSGILFLVHVLKLNLIPVPQEPDPEREPVE